jgi:hypothetical protein
MWFGKIRRASPRLPMNSLCFWAVFRFIVSSKCEESTLRSVLA